MAVPCGVAALNLRHERAVLIAARQDDPVTRTVAEWTTYDGWQGHCEVATPAEAVALCAKVESRVGAGRVLVGFTAPNGHFFGIALGHQDSSVMYWESAEPPYFQCRGNGTGEPLDFAYDGQHTEVPATSLISREVALKALSQFVQTGQRPDGLDWQET